MAKLADAPDLGSGAARHVGSTPIIRTAYQGTRNKENEIPDSLFLVVLLVTSNFKKCPQ